MVQPSLMVLQPSSGPSSNAPGELISPKCVLSMLRKISLLYAKPRKHCPRPLDISYLKLELLEILLDLGVLLRHFFILLLPLIPRGFQRLNFALVVTSFDVSLPESVLLFLSAEIHSWTSYSLTCHLSPGCFCRLPRPPLPISAVVVARLHSGCWIGQRDLPVLSSPYWQFLASQCRFPVLIICALKR